MAVTSNIHMGYMGFARINGDIFKITGSSLNPTQNINAPMLVQGSWLKKAWNYQAVEVGGNVTGPAAEKTFDTFWTYGSARDVTGDRLANNLEIELQYVSAQADGSTSERRRTFQNSQVASMSFSVTAGDVATFTIDFFGGATEYGASSGFGVDVDAGDDVDPESIDCEKLITWDQCSITSSGLGIDVETIQSWDITLNNNLTRAYTLGQDHLFPAEILAGIKEFNGTIGVYAPNAPLQPQDTGPFYGANQFGDYEAESGTTVTFTVYTTDLTAGEDLNIVTARTEAGAGTDLAVYTVRFEAVCSY